MGYTKDHAGDVYRMYNPVNSTVIETRDVKWADWHGGQPIPDSLKIMFAAHTKVDVKDFEILDLNLSRFPLKTMELQQSQLMSFRTTKKITPTLEQGGTIQTPPVLILLMQQGGMIHRMLQATRSASTANSESFIRPTIRRST